MVAFYEVPQKLRPSCLQESALGPKHRCFHLCCIAVLASDEPVKEWSILDQLWRPIAAPCKGLEVHLCLGIIHNVLIIDNKRRVTALAYHGMSASIGQDQALAFSILFAKKTALHCVSALWYLKGWAADLKGALCLFRQAVSRFYVDTPSGGARLMHVRKSNTPLSCKMSTLLYSISSQRCPS